MYAQNGGQQPGGPQGAQGAQGGQQSAGPNDQGYYDADYTVVDDDNK